MEESKDYDTQFRDAGRMVSLGSLLLPTGRIVACDPFFVSIAMPFRRRVRPGDFEVQLCVIAMPGYGERVALARLLFQPFKLSVSYEEALKESADTSRYHVAAGLGSFMDEKTMRYFVEVMVRFYQVRPNGNYYDDILASEFKRSAANPGDPRDFGNWNIHVLPDTGLNVAMFSSGLGDGTYSSYWGFDEVGEPVSLTTDFAILP